MKKNTDGPMLESMTGSARRSTTINGDHFEIYLRSVNHKYLETSFRLPAPLRYLEEELTIRIRKIVGRGRVDAEIQTTMEARIPFVDHGLMEKYASELGFSGKDANVNEKLRMLTLPGVVSLREELPGKFPLKKLLHEFDRTVEDLIDVRRKEGNRIESIFLRYLNSIEKEAGAIKKAYAKARKSMADRLLREIPGALGAEKVLSADWSNAIIEWYDKNDITEELERISMHVSAVKEIIRSGNDAGRKIEFFAQELLREVNTIGSKSRDFQIRSRVVEAKNLIEKIKEQVRNVC